MNNRGIQISFSWIFGIIVGAVILVLAVYAASNFVKTTRFETDSKVAAELGNLLNPVETNLESGRYVVIEFSEDTRVFNSCREDGNFGRQGISTSVKSGIGKEFERPGVESVSFNKYLFSDKVEEGRKLHVFVKPLEMPYKIADLVIASSDEYCFVQSPNDIEEEIDDLGVGNVNLSESVGNCNVNSVIVCFNNVGGGCDVNVNLQSKSVSKEGEIVYYEGDLIYGAIFSDPDIYECQVKRLMKRASELAFVYASKTDFLSRKGCSSNLAGDLVSFATLSQIDGSEGLRQVSDAAEELGRRNDLLKCKLF
jgi:hypothetical protein